MRIAIVDDIVSERESLHGRVDVQLARLALYADILEYSNGSDFLFAAKKSRFDLVFLDIYMETENGIETAKSLRRFDADCLLVFATTSTDHALDGFRVRAMHYLIKPYTDNELTALFDELVKRLPVPDQYLEVNSAGIPCRLRFGEILYAVHYQHQIHIYTTDGQKTVTRQTFQKFTANLCDERFFLCSRGVIVNLEHAADFDGTNFILRNGERIAVSRSLVKSARSAFGDFLFKRRPEL